MDLFQNKNITPMLLSEAKKPFDDSEYLFELKFDGTRTLIYADNNSILIKNRRGIILNKTYPELLEIKNQINQKVIFDGEIILMDNGKPSFEKLQARALLKNKLKIDYHAKNNPVTFIAYDLLYEGEDITHLSLIRRKKRLEKYKDTNVFIKAKYIEEQGILLFKETQKQGLEGIVAKHMGSTYQVGKRSKEWFKIKNMFTEKFYIGGYQEHPKGLSLLLIEKTDNKYQYVGKVNIAKSNSDYQIIKNMSINNKPAFFKAGFTHIALKLTCQVEYMNRTKNNFLRAPIYRGMVK